MTVQLPPIHDQALPFSRHAFAPEFLMTVT